MIKFSLFNFEKEDMCDTRPQNTDQTNPYSLDSPAITSSMTIYAHIINRLASNSNVCKTLAAGLVGLVVGLKTEITFWHLALILLCIFAISYQDCMYVDLKKKLEKLANDLREAVINADYSQIGPFMIPDSKHGVMETLLFWKSKSIWIFYAPMMLAVFGVWLIGGGFKTICGWCCNFC